jgi:hypothetical protein
MNEFISANAVALLILAFSVLWLICSALWSWWVEAPPLKQAIALSPPGKIETPVKVRISDEYELWLNFERAGLSLEALSEKTGGMRAGSDGQPVENPGIPVCVRWQLSARSGGEPVFAGEMRSTGANASSNAVIGRLLGRGEIPAGHYLFSAEIADDAAELREVPANLTLLLEPEKGHSLAVKIDWSLSLLGSFAVKPVAVIAAAVVAWNVARIYM